MERCSRSCSPSRTEAPRCGRKAQLPLRQGGGRGRKEAVVEIVVVVAVVFCVAVVVAVAFCVVVVAVVFCVAVVGVVVIVVVVKMLLLFSLFLFLLQGPRTIQKCCT